jgi:hypothetical protein
MRDASLDEFLGDTDEADEGSEGEAETGEDEAERAGDEAEPEAEPSSGSGERAGGEEDPGAGPEGPPPVADVEPARSTFAWSADGAACTVCGERIEERWESDEGLVCIECKEW